MDFVKGGFVALLCCLVFCDSASERYCSGYCTLSLSLPLSLNSGAEVLVPENREEISSQLLGRNMFLRERYTPFTLQGRRRVPHLARNICYSHLHPFTATLFLSFVPTLLLAIRLRYVKRGKVRALID